MIKRSLGIILILFTLAGAGYSETMLDYFNGRLPATLPPGATDTLPILQGGTAVRMIKSTDLGAKACVDVFDGATGPTGSQGIQGIQGIQGPPGPPGSVDQSQILGLLAVPGGNPISRQPLSPQTDATCMFELHDISPGNLRLCISGDGSTTYKNAAGQNVTKIANNGDILRYRAGGTVVAFAVYSSQVVIQ